VVERALEIAALMLGTDKSRGYSLEMICADFLAGAAPETDNSAQGHESSAPMVAQQRHMNLQTSRKKRHELHYFAKEISRPNAARPVFEAAEKNLGAR
jgi:hypothetical protein